MSVSLSWLADRHAASVDRAFFCASLRSLPPSDMVDDERRSNSGAAGTRASTGRIRSSSLHFSMMALLRVV